MAIDFNASNGATLGVEWEIQLVDAETRHLRQDAREVLAALPSLSLDGDNPRIRHELMESMVEVVTGICSTVGRPRPTWSARSARCGPPPPTAAARSPAPAPTRSATGGTR